MKGLGPSTRIRVSHPRFPGSQPIKPGSWAEFNWTRFTSRQGQRHDTWENWQLKKKSKTTTTKPRLNKGGKK